MSWSRTLPLNSRRYRRIFVACVATLGVSASLLGVILFVRWRADHAVQGDTRVVLDQAGQQLIRALQSRRGTLTLLRDMLDNAPDLNPSERQLLAKSAASHTRHLLGIGRLELAEPIIWWVEPTLSISRDTTTLNRTLTRSSNTARVWRVPTCLTLSVQDDRSLLVMIEPLRTRANHSVAIAGVFNLKPLLADFFELTLQQPYPVQLLDGEHTLYRSQKWESTNRTRHRTIIERQLHLDGLQWVLQMQPGITHTARTISSLNVLLTVVGAIASFVAIGLIWLLAMRTWILQRAVSRRTAALRRTTERLRQLATTDELTSVYNRRFFLERWQWEYQRAKRYERPLACLMIDVNHFKRINDLLGHHMGDRVITEVAEALRAQLRHADILARLGGDEFVVALPETSYAQAAAVAEKLRQLSIRGPWSEDAHLGPIHLSVGVSVLQASDTADGVIQKADADLYATRYAERKQRAQTQEALATPTETSSSAMTGIVEPHRQVCGTLSDAPRGANIPPSRTSRHSQRGPRPRPWPEGGVDPRS